MGVGHMARGIGVQIGAAIALSVLGMSLAVIWPVLLAIGTWRSLSGAKSAADRIRTAVVSEIITALRAQQPAIEKTIRDELTGKVDSVRQCVQDRMTVLVDEVRGQVQVVIQERQQHEQVAQDALGKLAKAKAVLLAQLNILNQLKASLEQA